MSSWGETPADEGEALRRLLEGVRAGRVEGTVVLESVRRWLEDPSQRLDVMVRGCLEAGPGGRSAVAREAETTDYTPISARVGGKERGGVGEEGLEPAPESPRYRTLGRVAVGGLGVVERAWDAELGREVALKRIRPDRAGDALGRTRFLREGWITAGLEHPGIVPVHGRGRLSDGQPFFAMRLVRGQSLKRAIEALHGREVGPPNEREEEEGAEDASRRFPETLRGLVGRLVQACQAVEYAHRRGIIHRDLKPENILLGPFGETLVVDWGLAKPLPTSRRGVVPPDGPGRERAVREEEGEGVELDFETLVEPTEAATRAGQVQGTIGYMSPEQARGEQERVGPASDVYSLGATLYTLLTGTAPIQVEGNPRRALKRVARGEIAAPSAVLAGVDPELERICVRAMALDPAARYESAGALAAALEEWLAEERAEAVRQLFAGALSAYGTLVFTVQDRLRPIPAAHGIREDLLNRAIRGLEDLVDRAGRDHAREVRRSLAAAYDQIADLEQQLGRTADARRHYEQALGVFKTMVPEHSMADPRDLGPLSVVLGKLGDILRRQGELVLAKEYYLRGLELTRSLAAPEPRSARSRRGLEIILGKLSSLCRQMGDLESARAYQEESLAISRSLLRGNPDDPRARRGLAIALGRLGDVCREGGDLDAAREHYARSLEISESLRGESPDDLRSRRGLVIAFNKLAEVERLRGELDSARRAASRGLELAEELAADDPWSVPARRDLAIACHRLGDIERQAGELEAARSRFLRGLDLMRALAMGDPDDAHARRGLLLAQLRLGELEHQMGRPQEARDCLREGLVLAEALALAEAHDAQAQLDVARACRLLGRLESDLGSPERSGPWYARGLDLLRSLRDRNRLSPSHEHLLHELEAELSGGEG